VGKLCHSFHWGFYGKGQPGRANCLELATLNNVSSLLVTEVVPKRHYWPWDH
jgi:hypothetical protein